MNYIHVRARAIFGALIVAVLAATLLLPATATAQTPDLDPPKLSVEATDNGLILRWDYVEGAKAYWYNISVGTDVRKAAEVPVSVDGEPSDSYVYVPMPPGKYTVKVRALETPGKRSYPDAGPWSRSVSATIKKVAPGPVQNLDAYCEYAGGRSQVVAEWDPPGSGAFDSYEVEKRVDGRLVGTYSTNRTNIYLGSCEFRWAIHVTVRAVDSETGVKGPPRSDWITK